jgi:hypothetical protein
VASGRLSHEKQLSTRLLAVRHTLQTNVKPHAHHNLNVWTRGAFGALVCARQALRGRALVPNLQLREVLSV